MHGVGIYDASLVSIDYFFFLFAEECVLCTNESISFTFMCTFHSLNFFLYLEKKNLEVLGGEINLFCFTENNRI